MKKFVFRYQKILEQREDEEEALKASYGAAKHRMHALMKAKADVISAQVSFFKDVEHRLESGVRSHELQQFEHSKLHFKDRIHGLDMKIAEAEIEVARLQNALVEAVKQRKIMEKLKEKAFEEYIDAVNAAENKVIEEIVNYRSSQKSGDT